MMEYFLAFMVGWCGTYWPRRFPFPVGPGPWDPNDPWPPGCEVCGPILGGLAAVVLEAVFGREVGTGLIEDSVLWFFAGAFGSSLVGGLMAFGKRRAPPAVNR